MNRATNEAQPTNLAANYPKNYRVEVSGWDAREQFFVEKTWLDWKEALGKTIELRAAVRLDSVLFIRLLRPLGGGAGIPVPYRAISVKNNAGNAPCLIVGLEQLQPSVAFRESVARLNGVVIAMV
jgi:hypothetical protein